MNSIRIGFIGITVEYWGKRMAEGVLHDFEGWLVFMFSVAAVVLVAYLLTKVGRRSRWSEAFDLAPIPAVTPGTPKAPALQWSIPRPFVVATAIVTAGAIAGLTMPERQSTIPNRRDFSEFPMQVADWGGHRGILDKIYLDALDLTDYLLVDYARASASAPINFYSAYYSEQKGFNRIHSPRNCIPGGGWEITQLTQRDIPLDSSGHTLPVNRAVIALGDQKELVYYWYQERGRAMTNENVVKWYLFWDSIKRNRTDGALVRIVAPLPRNAAEAGVDAEMQRFAANVEPQLSHYIPD
jgi:exosortase D (VPLPA-CTERM-specific)